MAEFLDTVKVVEYVIAPMPTGLYQIRPKGIWPDMVQLIAIDCHLKADIMARLDREGWTLISHQNLVLSDEVKRSQYKDRTFYSYILEKAKWLESTSE